MNIRASQVIYASAIAASLHLGLFVQWGSAQSRAGAIGLGEDGLSVGVGLAGSFEASQAQIQQDEVPERPDDKEPVPEEVPEAPAEELPPEIPEESSEETPTTEPTTPEQTELEVSEEIIEEAPEQLAELEDSPLNADSDDHSEQATLSIRDNPAPAPEPKAEPGNAPEALAEAKPESESQQNKQENAIAATQATGIGKTLDTGGNAALEQSYLARVQARAARFKRYPRSARKQGVTGTVTISFVITKNGRVRDSEIVNSSGDPRLDQEALDLLIRANPFPAIPEELSKDSMRFTLPIEFSLNSNRKLF